MKLDQLVTPPVLLLHFFWKTSGDEEWNGDFYESDVLPATQPSVLKVSKH